MHSVSLAARLCVAVVAIVAVRPASACTITNAQPTGTLPSAPGPLTFTFLATNDCVSTSFSAQDHSVQKTPRRGAAVGTTRHRYSVTLTPTERETLFALTFDTLAWRLRAQSALGDVARVGITNELDVDGDGWTRTAGDSGDCDSDAARNPGLIESWGNGDDDCDGHADNVQFDAPTAVVWTDLPTNATLGDRGIGAADLDGDGISDLAIAMPVGEGAVYVVRGPATGLVDVDDAIAISSATQPIGDSVSAMDANADGIDDLLSGASKSRNNTGNSYLFFGPMSGDRDVADADAIFTGPNFSGTGEEVDFVPDFDGDGAVDVVVGGVMANSYAGAVYVASGDATGTVSLGSDATHTFTISEPFTYLGAYNHSIGDVTGDGVGDLALSTASGTSSWRHVYLVEGGSSPGTYDVGDAAWAVVAPASTSTSIGVAVASGDYDGNGTRDLFVGDQTASAAYGFLEPLSGSTDAADADVRWEGGGSTGISLATGDVDGDDSLDLLIGAYTQSGQDGAVFLQLGGASGVVDVETLPFYTSGNSGDAGRFGSEVAIVPDWDGDGLVDIAVAAPYAGDDIQGTVSVFPSAGLF